MAQIFLRNVALPNKRIYDSIFARRFTSSSSGNRPKPYTSRSVIPPPPNGGIHTFFGRPVTDSVEPRDCVEISTHESLMSASNSQNDDYVNTLLRNEELRRQVTQRQSDATAALLTAEELQFQLIKYKAESETAHNLLRNAEQRVTVLETALHSANDEIARLKGDMDELLVELRSMPDAVNGNDGGGRVPVPFQLSDGAPPLPRARGITTPSTPRTQRFTSPSTPRTQRFTTPTPSTPTPARSPAVRFAGLSPVAARTTTPVSSPSGWEWRASQMSQSTIDAIMEPINPSPSPSPPPFDPARYIVAAKEILRQWDRLDQVHNVGRIASLPRSSWTQAFTQLNLDPTLSQAIVAKWDDIARCL
jgi:hypothetical protein